MDNNQVMIIRALVETFYKESAQDDNMFSEAKAQWLESCLESADDYDYETLMNDLDVDAHHWAEQCYRDCGYEWMYKAVKQAESEVSYLGQYPADITPPEA